MQNKRLIGIQYKLSNSSEKMRIYIAVAFLMGVALAKPLTDEDEPYDLSKGPYIEGDMIFGQGQRNGLIDEAYRWPKDPNTDRVLVPYFIDQSDPDFTDTYADMVREAIAEWPGLTNNCIHWIPRTEESDYVRITGEATGCFSMVGRQQFNQPQQLNLQPGSPGCIFGVGSSYHALQQHEELHAMGFYHEQSRPDRDDYVVIHLENVEPGKEHNFNKYDDTYVTAFGESYDYLSLMHYGQTEFSGNGQPTIITLDPAYQDQIGQRRNVSPSDLKKLMRMYYPDDGGENKVCA